MFKVLNINMNPYLKTMSWWLFTSDWAWVACCSSLGCTMAFTFSSLRILPLMASAWSGTILARTAGVKEGCRAEAMSRSWSSKREPNL